MVYLMRSLGVTVGLGAALGAGALGAEKDQYTLLNPTPREAMRAMSPDRPDVTESPRTVDAGHFQLELSLVEYAENDTDGAGGKGWSVAPLNLKVGLTNRVDMQFVIEPYVNESLREGGRTTREEGFGNSEVRLKVNLWGNDEGNTAGGVMPFVRFPTGDGGLASDHVEGGIILPFVLDLPGDAAFAVMGEVDFEHDDEHGWVMVLVHTVAVGKAGLIGDLGAYVEYVGAAASEGRYQASVGAGLTYPIGTDLQLDAAAYFGLSDEAEDFRLLVGMTYRM